MAELTENDKIDKVYQVIYDRFDDVIDKIELYYQSNNVWHLAKIILKPECQKQGYGSDIMTEIVRFADKYNKTVILTASTMFGASSKNRLEKFYSKFGFIRNRGKNKDYSLPWCGMYRMPK